MDELEKAIQGKQGGDRKSDKIKNDNIILDTDTGCGTSRATALRRLRKDRPDLHTQVIEKKLSPHAASGIAAI